MSKNGRKIPKRNAAAKKFVRATLATSRSNKTSRYLLSVPGSSYKVILVTPTETIEIHTPEGVKHNVRQWFVERITCTPRAAQRRAGENLGTTAYPWAALDELARIPGK